jgi:flap endonuclease-1
VMKDLELTREQLVDIGILVGTDYNPEGVKGVGPKTALKLIKKHGSLEVALSYMENVVFPHPLDEIRGLFLRPRTTDSYRLEWRKPDAAEIIGFLCGERNFGQSRVMNAIDKMNKGFSETGKRTTLDRFFG